MNLCQKAGVRNALLLPSDSPNDSGMKTCGQVCFRQSALLTQSHCERRHLAVISATARARIKVLFQGRDPLAFQCAGTHPGDQLFVLWARVHKSFSCSFPKVLLRSSIARSFSRALNKRDFTVPSEQFNASAIFSK